MLGMARASEYAGWWSGGAINISIPVSTTVTDAVYQTPSFSWAVDASPYYVGLFPPEYLYPSGSYGTVDLTGYTGLTGFNDRRFTFMTSVYLDWGAGMSDDYYGQASITWNTASVATNAYLTFNISGGSLNFGYGVGLASYYDGITLSGAYTNYINRWLTLVFSSAETSSVFTNWNPVSSGNQSYRFAVYDTATTDLLAKRDNNGTGTSYPSISGMGNTVPATSNTTVASTGYTAFFGGPDQTKFTRYANWWYCAGTMWDPVTAKSTDTTWFTTRPNNTIGTGKAWINVPFASLTSIGANQGFLQSSQDLYSQANSVVTTNNNNGYTSADVTQAQSTTIIPKDQS